ncbi:MAG: hypothetical protein HW390_3233 [Candidatus Brocadiaceae bacterium]|nr:hypothetical protein [Candidatus Brocadiaceae bacterium]
MFCQTMAFAYHLNFNHSKSVQSVLLSINFLFLMRVFHVYVYVRALTSGTKVIISEQEKFWPFWSRPKASLGIPVFVEPPCRATSIFLESEKAFVVAAKGGARKSVVPNVFSGFLQPDARS